MKKLINKTVGMFVAVAILTVMCFAEMPNVDSTKDVTNTQIELHIDENSDGEEVCKTEPHGNDGIEPLCDDPDKRTSQ